MYLYVAVIITPGGKRGAYRYELKVYAPDADTAREIIREEFPDMLSMESMVRYEMPRIISTDGPYIAPN